LRILLVSSTSFIGKNLAKSLISSGHEVYSLDRTRINNQIPKDKIFLYDICRPETIIQAFRIIKNIDVCINLSGGAGASQSPKSIFQVNYIGVKYLYAACRIYRVKRFIQLSSASVYGKVKKGQVINESSDTFPFNNYSMAKLMADEYLMKNQNENTDVIILRLPLVYGKETSVTIPGLVDKIKTSKFILFGKGKNIIHPLHVDNLTDLIVNIIDLKASNISGLFVLSDNDYFDLRFLLDTIANRFSPKKSYRVLPLSFLYFLYGISNFLNIIFGKALIKKENLFFYSSSRVIDTSKAKKVLEYNPIHGYQNKIFEAVDSFI